MMHLFSGSTGLPASLKALFSVLWLGTVNGNELVDVIGGNNFVVTNKDFTTTIPSTSSATIALPNVAALKNDDLFDNGWFTFAGAVNQVTPLQLVTNDYSRTLVKFNHESPYEIEWIGLLDDASTPTTDEWNQLHYYFGLHIFWSGIWNDYGYFKDNKELEGQGYKGWIGQVQALGLTEPSTSVKAALNVFCLYCINNSLWRDDRLFPFMLNDSALVTGAGTVSLRNPGSTRFTFPNGATYTASGWKGGGSPQYGETNFNPSTQAQNFTLNNASRKIYVYEAGVPTDYYDGHVGTAGNVMTNSDSTTLQQINGASLSGGDTRALGYKSIDRSSSTRQDFYKGVTSVGGTSNSTLIPNATFVVNRSNFGYGRSGISFWGAGPSYTAAEHLKWNTAFEAYKTRLGL